MTRSCCLHACWCWPRSPSCTWTAGCRTTSRRRSGARCYPRSPGSRTHSFLSQVIAPVCSQSVRLVWASCRSTARHSRHSRHPQPPLLPSLVCSPLYHICHAAIVSAMPPLSLPCVLASHWIRFSDASWTRRQTFIPSRVRLGNQGNTHRVPALTGLVSLNSNGCNIQILSTAVAGKHNVQ